MKKLHTYLLIVVYLINCSWANGQIQITLRQSFIDSIKNTVTIKTAYIIDKAHAHPNSPSKDGDMHIAGRAETIGLPIVAEIMNASGKPQSVSLVHSLEGSDSTVIVTGVWRLWCEHAGEDVQVQGRPLTQFHSTNPAHVFEIHPITGLNNFNLLTSLKPITGYTYKNVEDALMRYTATRCHIIPKDDSTIIIQTNGVGFNYVDCKIEILNSPFKTEDGRFIFCKILKKDGEVVAQKVRVGFVKGSKPEQKVKGLNVGDQMNIIAIPRIDLALVSFRISHANDSEFPDILSWNLPFELVAVAVSQ
jgi:hypothetical protein